MKLTRFCFSEQMGTFGQLECQGETFYTVEKPFKNNLPFVSCVPAGEYSLMPYQSVKYGDTFKLVSVPNNVMPDKIDDKIRYGILIHRGNTVDNVVGCIAVGDKLGMVNGKWAVMNSRQTMDRLRKLWQKEKPLKLEIENVG